MSDSVSSEIQNNKEPTAYTLAQERRAALEHIDKARFKYVFLSFYSLFSSHLVPFCVVAST
jgi:hypothetical protein